jgi:hypothetical protein
MLVSIGFLLDRTILVSRKIKRPARVGLRARWTQLNYDISTQLIWRMASKFEMPVLWPQSLKHPFAG